MPFGTLRIAKPLPAISSFIVAARSKTMGTPHLIAPARMRATPIPCGILPSRPPASRVRSALEFWPFSAFTRAAYTPACLQLAITPTRLCAWDLIFRKDFECKSISNQKSRKQVTMASIKRVLSSLKCFLVNKNSKVLATSWLDDPASC